MIDHMLDHIKTVYERYVSIRLSSIVLAVLTIAMMVLSYFYFTGNADAKIGSLLGGLVATLFAVVIQFLLTLAHYREIERLRSMGFRDILPHREERKTYYSELLRNARKHIDFIGKTASSFLADFATDTKGGPPIDRLLIDALDRGVRVRILVAKRDQLSREKRGQFDEAHRRMRELADLYPDRFAYKQLRNFPTQTWVQADNRCVFGPVFPSIPSSATPAIYADGESPFLECYTRYFDSEWEVPQT